MLETVGSNVVPAARVVDLVVLSVFGSSQSQEVGFLVRYQTSTEREEAVPDSTVYITGISKM